MQNTKPVTATHLGSRDVDHCKNIHEVLDLMQSTGKNLSQMSIQLLRVRKILRNIPENFSGTYAEVLALSEIPAEEQGQSQFAGNMAEFAFA